MVKILEALKGLFKQNPARAKAEGLYAAAVAQARDPLFYNDYGVPDTVDGRFEMITLHVYALITRAQKGGDTHLAQALFDALFKDMELNLREMGVGDLGVPKKIKRMMIGFNGRCHAYAAAFTNKNTPLALEDALRRNVYGTLKNPNPARVAALAAYTWALMDGAENSFPDTRALLSSPHHETHETRAAA